jgi:hypothetical protein
MGVARGAQVERWELAGDARLIAEGTLFAAAAGARREA